jgi:iron(III) transport system permease protein
MTLGPTFRRANDTSFVEAVLIGFLCLFVAALIVWPMVRLALEAIAPGGTPTLAPMFETLREAATWRAAWRSFETSLVGALGAVALGGAFAFLVALTDIRAKLALVFCFMLPMMVPPAVTALSWATLAGPASPLLKAVGLAPPPGSDNPMYSAGGIMLLLAIQHAPLAFLVLRAGLRAIPRELVEAGRLSGAGTAEIARSIVAPILWPSIAAALALAFVSALGNFGIPAILGIGERYYVLPTLIYVRLSSQGPTVLTQAAILSLIVAAIGVAAVMLQLFATRRASMRLAARPGAPLALNLGRWRLLVEAAAWTLLVVILVLPLLALIATALVPAYGVPLSSATATLENFREVLLRQAATIRAFANSFWLSVGAAVVLAALALPLGYALVWKRSRLAAAIATAADVPYALPGVVLAIAMILVFLRPLPIIDLSLYGTVWLIFVAYLARFFVLAAKPVIAGFQQLDPRLDEAARVAGAGFVMRARTILVPVLAPVAIAGGLLVFLTAFNELTVSALLWSAGSETLGVVIFNLEDSGLPTLAAAISVISVAVMFAAMGLLQAISKRLPAGVLPWGNDR